jgi:hypothetical protein
MLMRACRHDEDQEQLTPCHLSPTDLTPKMFQYINNMHSTVSEMSAVWEAERFHVKKLLIM